MKGVISRRHNINGKAVRRKLKIIERSACVAGLILSSCGLWNLFHPDPCLAPIPQWDMALSNLVLVGMGVVSLISLVWLIKNDE